MRLVERLEANRQCITRGVFERVNGGVGEMLATGWSIFACWLTPHCGSGGIGFRMAPLSE